MNNVIFISLLITVMFHWNPVRGQKRKSGGNQGELNVITETSIREILQLDNGEFYVKELTSKKVPIMYGTCKSLKPDIRHGEFIFFSKEGEIHTVGYYEDNVPVGIWNIYDTKGEIIRQLDYDLILKTREESGSGEPAGSGDSSDEQEYDFSNYEEELPEDPLFIIVEDMPRFQGGEHNHFRNYITQNLVYPPYCIQRDIAGQVFVNFVVNKSGQVVSPNIARSAFIDLDREVLRIVSQSPAWTPGRQRGENVDVQFTFPVVFMLR